MGRCRKWCAWRLALAASEERAAARAAQKVARRFCCAAQIPYPTNVCCCGACYRAPAALVGRAGGRHASDKGHRVKKGSVRCSPFFAISFAARQKSKLRGIRRDADLQRAQTGEDNDGKRGIEELFCAVQERGPRVRVRALSRLEAPRAARDLQQQEKRAQRHRARFHGGQNSPRTAPKSRNN